MWKELIGGFKLINSKGGAQDMPARFLQAICIDIQIWVVPTGNWTGNHKIWSILTLHFTTGLLVLRQKSRAMFWTWYLHSQSHPSANLPRDHCHLSVGWESYILCERELIGGFKLPNSRGGAQDMPARFLQAICIDIQIWVVPTGNWTGDHKIWSILTLHFTTRLLVLRQKSRAVFWMWYLDAQSHPSANRCHLSMGWESYILCQRSW